MASAAFPNSVVVLLPNGGVPRMVGLQEHTRKGHVSHSVAQNSRQILIYTRTSYCGPVAFETVAFEKKKTFRNSLLSASIYLS